MSERLGTTTSQLGVTIGTLSSTSSPPNEFSTWIAVALELDGQHICLKKCKFVLMTFQHRPCPQWQAPHQGSWCLRLVRLRPSCTCTKTFGILSRKLTCCWHNRGTPPSWLTPSECNQPVQPLPGGTVSYYLLSRLRMHLGVIESDMEKSADRANFRRFTLVLK